MTKYSPRFWICMQQRIVLLENLKLRVGLYGADMKNILSFPKHFVATGLFALLFMVPYSRVLSQTTVDIASIPLLALKSAPGLVMMTMSRDHRLFYAAYNDTSDIDGDGTVDIGFKPTINYYGNFVTNRCYDYVTISAGNSVFRPLSIAAATGCKSGSTQLWHGNWLNWATTSRMDALRRVLYGGQRVVDNATTSAAPILSSTTLQGAFIPQDSHVWGKEYRPGRDVYDITQYTKLPTPSNLLTKQHLFVVVSPNGNASYPFLSTSTAPVLRYITDADQTTERIWAWASADVAQGIGSNPANFTKLAGRASVTATDAMIRVEACVPISGIREAGCKGYPSTNPVTWKPTGVLHDYSANDQLKFGLITGSYEKNYSGGVLRRNITSFNDEVVAATGQFKTTNDGIARTIDRITVHGWGGSQYDCGYKTNGNRNQGACKSWGAPVGEMMYEGLRYFSGKAAGTTAFVYSSGTAADITMGFPSLPTWENPFRPKASGGNPICSRPVQMVIADPLTSFDSDQLPGTYFTPTTDFGAALGFNDLTGLNVSTEAANIWTLEGLGTRNIYIGQSGTVIDGNPTAKTANSFATIRGHAPDETQSQGSFYSAAVASFGRSSSIPKTASSSLLNMVVGPNPSTPSDPANTRARVDTISVALGSLTPRIEFPNPSGGKVSIVPISKAIGGGGIDKSPNKYQATGAITGFYYSNYTPTSVTAIVNFSDGDQGTDNETDAQVQYDIALVGSSITVRLTQLDKNPGGIQSNIGYVISGTTKDGLYLETRTNKNGTSTPISAGDVYYLDTLAGQDPAPPSPSIRLNGNGVTHPGAVPYLGVAPNNYPSNPAIVANVCPAFDPANPPNPLQPAGGSATSAQGVQRTYNAVHLQAINACLPSWDKPTSRTFALSSVASPTGAFLPQDTLWYAAKYGGTGELDSNLNPTNYFKISNPTELPVQMGKAFRSAAALAAASSTAVVGVGQRSAGSAAIYQANYDSLTWTSRLYAFPVALNGSLSNVPIWEASTKVPSSRNLFLGRGSSTPLALVPTSTGYGALTTAEVTDFGSQQVFNYLLGDTSGEERKSGKFRNRGSTSGSQVGSVIGDIVNSDPQIISKKDYGYTASDATYSAFWNGINFETLAVGSNDGFFRIFDGEPDATGGIELFGFMPRAARTSIKDLSSPDYKHRNFIDGPTGLGHAKIKVPGNAVASWRSVAVGTGGGGAQTVFAINTSTKTYSANSILWEIDAASLGATNAVKFGNVIGRPVIGKLNDGTWVAIFGNGYNSTAGTANLFVVKLEDGSIVRIISTNTAIGNNGLGTVDAVRKSFGNQDTIDYIYGADYKGNIWRFDPNTNNTGSLIFSTPTGRPITAEIKVGNSPAGALTANGKMVYFGTGSYISATDPANTQVQALYGIYDDLVHTSTTSAFASTANLSSMTITAVAGADTRQTSAAATPAWYTVAGKKGWVVQLTGTNVAVGERVIAPPVRYTVAGLVDAFLFTSIVPSSDDCKAGLDAWITGINVLTGGYESVFDGLTANSVRLAGGSPRGVFVLQDGGIPTLYISQTIFDGVPPTSTYTTGTGGSQTVVINGVEGTTRIISIKLKSATPTATARRQIWRQLK
jgi:type IV pilus assembly protein PilY1